MNRENVDQIARIMIAATVIYLMYLATPHDRLIAGSSFLLAFAIRVIVRYHRGK